MLFLIIKIKLEVNEKDEIIEELTSSTVAKFAIVQKEGSHDVIRNVEILPITSIYINTY